MLERSKEVLERWKAKGLNAMGKFVPSSKPSALAVRHKPQPSMFDIVREAVRSQRLADEANAEGFDTFEEANDFDDPDEDRFPSSPHERPFEEMEPGELTRRKTKAEREAAAKAAEAAKRREERAAEEAEPEGGAKRERSERRAERVRDREFDADPE